MSGGISPSRGVSIPPGITTSTGISEPGGVTQSAATNTATDGVEWGDTTLVTWGNGVNVNWSG